MDELKAEVCRKALTYLQNVMLGYSKTGNTFLDLGLGYVRMAHTEPALFKAIYIDDAMNVKLTDIFPENQQIVELMKNSEHYQQLSDKGIKNSIAKAWMLVHGIATLVATGMFAYDEEMILEIISK